MDEARRLQVRRYLAAFNLAAICLIIPAILHHHIFSLPPSQAPGSRTVLVTGLVIVWLALAGKTVATPSGRPWPYWIRALLFAGGNLSMALLMFLVHRP